MYGEESSFLPNFSIGMGKGLFSVGVALTCAIPLVTKDIPIENKVGMAAAVFIGGSLTSSYYNSAKTSPHPKAKMYGLSAGIFAAVALHVALPHFLPKTDTVSQSAKVSVMENLPKPLQQYQAPPTKFQPT